MGPKIPHAVGARRERILREQNRSKIFSSRGQNRSKSIRNRGDGLRIVASGRRGRPGSEAEGQPIDLRAEVVGHEVSVSLRREARVRVVSGDTETDPQTTLKVTPPSRRDRWTRDRETWHSGRRR